MEYWNRINTEIKRQKVTQDWVAKTAGISPSTFRGWITRNRLPRVDEAIAIAQVLDRTVEFFYSGSDYEDPWLRENQDIIRNCKKLPPETLNMIRSLLKVHVGEISEDDTQQG